MEDANKEKHSHPSSAKTMRRTSKMYKTLFVDNFIQIIFGNRPFCAKMILKRGFKRFSKKRVGYPPVTPLPRVPLWELNLNLLNFVSTHRLKDFGEEISW